MSKNSHTRGPWRAVIRANQHGVKSVFVDTGNSQGRVWTINNLTSPLTEQNAADARLIAAAPSLLSVCEELIQGDGSAESLQRAIDLAHAALTKVKGEQK